MLGKEIMAAAQHTDSRERFFEFPRVDTPCFVSSVAGSGSGSGEGRGNAGRRGAADEPRPGSRSEHCESAWWVPTTLWYSQSLFRGSSLQPHTVHGIAKHQSPKKTKSCPTSTRQTARYISRELCGPEFTRSLMFFACGLHACARTFHLNHGCLPKSQVLCTQEFPPILAGQAHVQPPGKASTGCPGPTPASASPRPRPRLAASELQPRLGCLFLHTDLGPPSKTKDGIQLSVWRAFTKALREVSGSGLEVDLIAAKPCRYTTAAGDMPSKPPEPSSSPLSLVLFQLERPSFSAEWIAEAVCRGFASEADSKSSFCRGRLARHRPRELLLLHGSRFGAQARLWTSLAPGSEAVLRLGGPIPWDFLAALDFFEVPRFVDVKCVHVGASGLLRAEWARNVSAQSGEGEAEAFQPKLPSFGSLEWTDPDLDPIASKKKRSTRTAAEAEAAEAEEKESSEEEPAEEGPGGGPPQLWGIIRARRRRWADETDSDDEGQKKAPQVLVLERRKEQKKREESSTRQVVRMAHADTLPPESATSSLPEASPKAQSPGTDLS